MSDDFEWSDWIEHDDQGLPEDVEPDEVVIACLSGDVLSPMPAMWIDWCCPGDPVHRYRRRVWPKALEAPTKVELVPA
jgi:hypothetical protein